MAHELAFGGAEHPDVVDQHAIGVAHALIRVEEHDEENERDGQRDLRPDAETEPEQEQRREDDARHRVQHLDVRIEDARQERRPREREAERDANRRADEQAEERFLQRDREVSPQRAARDPADDTRADVARPAHEERIEQLQRDERLPRAEKRYADGELPKKDGRA